MPPSEKPIWYRCHDCNAEFAVAEKASPVVHQREVKHCPFCGSARLHHGYESHPEVPGRWR